MSAAPRHPDADELGYFGLRMSAEEFLRLGETRDRYELVHGVVCMSPRPASLHQRLLSLIQFQLELYLRDHPGAMYLPEVNVRISADTVYSPDIVCFQPGRLAGFPIFVEVAPDLVIEVLSPGSKAFDLTTKRGDFEKFGVAEYWTYDPKDGSLRCFRRDRGRLVEAPVSGERISSTALSGFTLDLRPLRDAAGNK
jgi:Uma2 family endonuclease